MGAAGCSAGGDVVQLFGATENAFSFNPTPANAGYRIPTDGIEESGTGNPISYSDVLGAEEVVKPVSNLSDYEVRMTVNSGTFSSGTTGTWQSLGTQRTWTKTQSSVGSSSVNGTIEIRKIGTTDVLASATVDLTAEVSA